MTDRLRGFLMAQVAGFEQHLSAGGEFLRQDRVTDARDEFLAALEIKPGDARALGRLGLAYFRLAVFDRALPVYEQLVELEPADASFWLNLGLVHLKLGNAREAIDNLSRSRELDPSQARTVSYLGLAFARAGEYADAYEAFLHAEQTDLADEMAKHLDQDERAAIASRVERIRKGEKFPGRKQKKRKKPAPPDDDEPQLASGESGEAGAREVIAGHDEVDAALSGLDALAERLDEEEPEPEPEPDPEPEPELAPDSEFDEEPELFASPPEPISSPIIGLASDAYMQVVRDAPSKPDGVPTAYDREDRGMITQVIDAAAPTGSAATAKRVALGHRGPEPISDFATARLIRPEDGDAPFELGAGGVLIVRVADRVMSRTEEVICSGGELAYEPATRRVRGKSIEARFGADGRQMFIVTGSGYLIASPVGEHFAAVSLDDDILYLRENLVFAFESDLSWESGHVPGSNHNVQVVQFRGRGCVAIRSKRPLLSVKLASSREIYVESAVLAGWIGRVVPRWVSPVAGGDASAPFVECSGEGVVLLEDASSQ